MKVATVLVHLGVFTGLGLGALAVILLA